MSLNILSKSTIAAVALCAALPLTTTLASATVCKPNSVSASGAKKWTNISARLSARWAWHQKVKSQYGFVWSTYALAKNKGYDCHRVGAKWRCTAYGRPCRAGN